MSSVERFLAFDAAPHLKRRRYPSPVAGAVKAGERVFLSGSGPQQPDGSISGLGDPAAQADAAVDNIEAGLAAAGGKLSDITKLTTCIVDRAHRKAVYQVIGRRLQGVFPVSTGLVVAGLPLVEQMVQINADAVIGSPIQRLRCFEMKNWFEQNIAWQGSMLAAGERELFIRGQTGSALDGSYTAGLGRQPQDAAAQAELALTNLATLLSEVGSAFKDICKMTVYISDRAYRLAVYPVIGRHLRGIHPVSTGIITTAFARPEILFEIDIQAVRGRGRAHQRLRQYHSSKAKYGSEQQSLDCDLCMAVRAGNRVILRGQTGGDLKGVMRGQGDVVVQSEQAMDNVEILLGEAGASLTNVTSATLFVTDRAFLSDATEVVLRRLEGVTPAFTAIVIKGLASPGLLMEIDITADLGERA